MKKDIEIPEVKDVHVAAVKQFNEEFRVEEWNAYIINNRQDTIEMVLIVSGGYDDSRQTSNMRHRLEKLPAGSFAKIEFLQDDVLALNNEFWITFFAEGKMFEKKYLFPKDSINDNDAKEVPVMLKKGILAL